MGFHVLVCVPDQERHSKPAPEHTSCSLDKGLRDLCTGGGRNQGLYFIRFNCVREGFHGFE